MRRLSVVTWIGNAAAVLLGRWGDVSRQAEAAGCSRQIAYQHARRVQQAVAQQDGDGPTRQGLLDEIQALRRENRQLWEWLSTPSSSPRPSDATSPPSQRRWASFPARSLVCLRSSCPPSSVQSMLPCAGVSTGRRSRPVVF